MENFGIIMNESDYGWFAYRNFVTHSLQTMNEFGGGSRFLRELLQVVG